MSHKLPVSVLVIVHTAGRDVLLLERALGPGYWQSVTGSVEYDDEPLEHAACDRVEAVGERALADQPEPLGLVQSPCGRCEERGHEQDYGRRQERPPARHDGNSS